MVPVSKDPDIQNVLHWFKSIVENLHDGILVEDANRKIIIANQRFCEIYNVPVHPTEMVGQDCSQAVHNAKPFLKEPDVFISRVQDIIKEKKRVLGDTLHFVSGLIYERDYLPIYKDDIYLGCIWQYREITAKQNVEAKLLEQRQFFQKILNGIPSDIAVFDKDHKYLFLNPHAISDPSLREWMIGKDDFDYCVYRNKDISIAENRRAKFNEVLSTRSEVEWEERLYRCDGEPEFHLRRMFPLYNDVGEIAFVIGYGIDITSIKKSKIQIRESEERLRNMFQQTTGLIFKHDAFGKFIEANYATCQALGISDTEILGTHFQQFIHPEYLQEFENYLISIKEGKDLLKTIIHLRTKGDEVAYWRCNVHHTKNISGVTVFADDITDLMVTQRELIKTTHNLEETSKAKEQFFASMSHEIRTPLNGIIGITRLLSNTILNEQQQSYLQLIHQSSEHLKVLINDVLDISKIRLGKLKFEQLPFDIAGALKEAVNLFYVMAREKSITLKTKLSLSGIDYVRGDSHRLNQVIVNLLSNALKFTPPGGEIVVSININPSHHILTELRGEVRDSGIGIAKEKAEGIFNEFEQADASVSRKYGGTGLGLTICKNIVEMQGGKIGVVSEENQGSTFWFTIPYERCSVDEYLHYRDVNFKPIHNFNQEAILLAEDNPINSLLANTLLTDWNLKVHNARNGREAVELASEIKFDLILMDIQMPELDGLSAFRLIKLNSLNKETPVVGLTANALQDQVEEYLNEGMRTVVAKPFEPEDLNHAITKFIKGNPTVVNNPVSVVNVASISTVTEEFHANEFRFFSPQKFDKQTMGQSHFKKGIRESFLEFTPGMIDEIRQAERDREASKLQAVVHKLKASVTMFCVETLRTDIIYLEKNTEFLNSVEYRRRLNGMLEDVSILLQEITEYEI